jgi:N6-adenosine-specific RNA methylase IME4
MLAGKKPDPTQNFAQGETRAELAKLADVSHETVRKVERITEHAPEPVKAAARRGDISVNAAYKLTKALEGASAEVRAIVEQYGVEDADTVDELKRIQREAASTFEEIRASGFIQPGDEAEAVPVNGGFRRVKEAMQAKARIHAQLAMEERRARAAATPAPAGKYRCIVIDPPWPVQKIEREVRPNQGQTLDYPTMTLEEIAALPVSDLAFEDGCHLYLWTTQKYLPDALRLMALWNFNYQCVMTWVKPTGMTPYSWMYNTELVLFGRRGDLPLVRNGLKLSFEAAVTVHSAKPDVFYERVLAASPEPRLELFARQERAGFAAWGDEICVPT